MMGFVLERLDEDFHWSPRQKQVLNMQACMAGALAAQARSGHSVDPDATTQKLEHAIQE